MLPVEVEILCAESATPLFYSVWYQCIAGRCRVSLLLDLHRTALEDDVSYFKVHLA